MRGLNGWVLRGEGLGRRLVPCGFASKSGSREGPMYGAVSDRGRGKQARVGSGAGASGLDGYTEVDPNPRGVLRFGVARARIAGGIWKTPGVYAGKANRNTKVRFVRRGSLSRRFACWGEKKWSQKGPYPWGIRRVANLEKKVNRRGRRWVFSGGRKARGRGMAGT